MRRGRRRYSCAPRRGRRRGIVRMRRSRRTRRMRVPGFAGRVGYRL